MKVGKLLDEREADARALVRTGARVPDAVETLEQARQFGRRDTDAGVDDHAVRRRRRTAATGP